MAKRESFLRYILIIERLRYIKQASFEEISDYLDRMKDIIGEDLIISKRTFQRDLNEIRSIFKIDIQCNKSHEYHIEEDDTAGFASRLMEEINISNLFSTVENLSPYIIMESRKAMGSENIYGLLHGIRNRFVVNFNHIKYWDDVKTERTVEPYALKEFKGRWYLLAKEIVDRNLHSTEFVDRNLRTSKTQTIEYKDIRTFGLDRISELEITKMKFKHPQELNVKTMFQDCFGIINPSGEEPEEIVLSFDPEQGKYIKSYPLHHSQKELIDNEDEYRISLKLKITYDFIQELAWNMNTFRVIKPASLKKELSEIWANAIERNK